MKGSNLRIYEYIYGILKKQILGGIQACVQPPVNEYNICEKTICLGVQPPVFRKMSDKPKKK